MATVRLNVEVKSDTSGALAATVKELENVDKAAQQANKSMKPLSDGFKESNSRIGEFADTVGRTSTTLARSADAFGLPTQALRTLDDVMDVTEIGFKNLSSAAAGFNAASVGAAGAGLAIGTMIGTWIRDIPAVAKAVDDLAVKLYNLVGIKTQDAGWSPGALEKVKAAQANVNAEMAKSIDLLHQQGKSAKEIEEILKGKRAVTGEIKDPIQAQLESYRKMEEAQKKQEEAQKRAKALAEEAKKAEIEHNTAMSKGFEAAGAYMLQEAFAQDQTNEKLKYAENQNYLNALAAGEVVTKYQEASDQITEDMIPAMAMMMGISEDTLRVLLGFQPALEGASDKASDFSKHMEKVAHHMDGISDVLGAAGDLVGGKLGKTLTGLGGIGKSASSGLKALAQGDIYGAITGGLGAIKGIIGLFKKDWTKVAQEAAKGIADAIAKGTSAASFIPNLLKDKKTAMDTFATLSDQFAQMQEEYRNKIIENQQKGIAGIVTMVNNLGDAASVTQGSLDRMGTYTIAMFDTLRKQGVSFLDALKMIQPALDAIAKKAKESGKEMPKALADYQKFLDFGKANAGLFDTAQAQGDVISAMRHGGAIDPTNLKDLSKDVLGNVNAIRGGLGAQGMADTKAHNMALAQNAEALFQLKKASEQYGIALDAQTQAEVDAAEAAGLFEGKEDPLDSMKASMDAMVQVLAAIAQAFGATLPDAVQKYIDTLNKIPTPPAPPGAPGGEAAPPGAPAPPPPGAPAPPPPHMAAGGLVSKPTYALIGEAGPEMVVPVGSARSSSSAAAVAAAMGASGKETSINLGNLHINQQPGEDPQALADRILQTVVQGVRYNKAGLRTEMRYASEGR